MDHYTRSTWQQNTLPLLKHTAPLSVVIEFEAFKYIVLRYIVLRLLCFAATQTNNISYDSVLVSFFASNQLSMSFT